MNKQQKLNQAIKFMVLADAIFNDSFDEKDFEDNDGMAVMVTNLKTALDGAQNLRFRGMK